MVQDGCIQATPLLNQCYHVQVFSPRVLHSLAYLAQKWTDCAISTTILRVTYNSIHSDTNYSDLVKTPRVKDSVPALISDISFKSWDPRLLAFLSDLVYRFGGSHNLPSDLIIC